MEFLLNTWEWYVAGPLIGLFVPMLLIFNNKQLGISSSFEHICHISLPEKMSTVVAYNKSKNNWKFYFVIGIALGAFISVTFLSGESVAFLPQKYYQISGYLQLFAGGLLVGFGTRYADGCTSGHSITGLSLMESSSLKATIAFFAGGLLYTTFAVYI